MQCVIHRTAAEGREVDSYHFHGEEVLGSAGPAQFARQVWYLRCPLCMYHEHKLMWGMLLLCWQPPALQGSTVLKQPFWWQPSSGCGCTQLCGT